MASDPTKELLESLSVPFGDLIAEVGRGVAEAQYAIDSQTLEALKTIYNSDNGQWEALREIGYEPTWYHIPEASAELNLALSLSGSETTEKKSTMYATSVDAVYSNSFEFDVQASSKLKFRIVPVPPPANVSAMQITPKIISMKLGEAKKMLQSLNIHIEYQSGPNISDNSVITGQAPAPGEILGENTPISLQFD